MYSSPNIIWLIKSRRMNWEGDIQHGWGRGDLYTGFWWGNLMERGHLENPGVVGRIILKWILRKWDVGAWPGLMWFRIETGGGLF